MDVVQKLAMRMRLESLEKKVAVMGEELSKQISLRGKAARLSTKEVAQMLRKHPKTIELWTRKKGLPCKHDGRNLVFILGDVLRWQAQRES